MQPPHHHPNETTLRSHLEAFCRERNEAAFRAFYDASKHAVLRIAVHLCGKGEQAFDLSQEIWVKLWKHLCGFRGESKLSSWIYRVAMTTYLDKKPQLISSAGNSSFSQNATQRALIREEISHLEEVGNESHEATFVMPPQGHNPETILETESAHSLVERALARLTPAERTVFVAKHFHDLTFREIAAELGTHEGTAKTLHFRALKKLQNILAAHYPELRGDGIAAKSIPKEV